MTKEKDMTNITPAALKAAVEGDLTNFLVASTPGGIERQEAAGQAAMVANFKTLPKDMDRAVGEKLGFVYGEDADEIFVSVTPPAGWSLKPTSHSMHSDLLDDKGRRRAGIFYKATFYNRNANGHWHTRYGVERDYDEEGRGYTLHVRDRSTGTSLHSIRVDRSEEDGAQGYERARVLDNDALHWLNENFAEHRDPLAYWHAV